MATWAKRYPEYIYLRKRVAVHRDGLKQSFKAKRYPELATSLHTVLPFVIGPPSGAINEVKTIPRKGNSSEIAAAAETSPAFIFSCLLFSS